MVLASLAPLPSGMLLLQHRCQQVCVYVHSLGDFLPLFAWSYSEIMSSALPKALSLNQPVCLPKCLR